MCDAVASSGWEILKFIGDAMLAIFTVIASAVNLTHLGLDGLDRNDMSETPTAALAVVGVCRAGQDCGAITRPFSLQGVGAEQEIFAPL
jgi:class 3 adenylate cyclase